MRGENVRRGDRGLSRGLGEVVLQRRDQSFAEGAGGRRLQELQGRLGFGQTHAFDERSGEAESRQFAFGGVERGVGKRRREELGGGARQTRGQRLFGQRKARPALMRRPAPARGVGFQGRRRRLLSPAGDRKEQKGDVEGPRHPR